MKKVIIHIIDFNNISSKVFEEDLELLKEIGTKRGVENIFFYLGDFELEDIINNELFKYFNFKDEDDLFKKILEINKKNEIIFINTLLETQIKLVNKLRELIGQETSLDFEIFNNKAIQRELLYKNDSNISVKYLKSSIENLNYEKIVEKIGVPFVLKPLNGVQSAGVVKIKTQKNFDRYFNNYKNFHSRIVNKGLFDSNEIIAEEFINGNFYSIDYLVKQDGTIICAKPVKVTLGTDMGIKDFFNCSKIISKEVEEEYDYYKVLDFIKKTIKATGIKNTFIHHEFKINKKGQYKTIELNGRIGGRRTIIYKYGYDINLYDFLFDDNIENKIKNNLVFSRIYACRNGVLKGFNDDLFGKIEKFDSFNSLSKIQKYIGKEVGLTKNGFGSVANVRLINNNLKILKKDSKFIEDNYCQLLELEEKLS